MSACRGDLSSIEAIVKIDEGPVESGYNVEIIYSDRAFVRMILHTPQMDRYENDKNFLEMPKGLHVVFYDTLGHQTSSLTANYAISYDDTEVIEARNDVIVINEAGERLNTEHLIWDQKQEIIYSDKFVKITTEDEVTYGEGFLADERFDQWEISNPRGTFKIDTETRQPEDDTMRTEEESP
ncbi:MAG: LPS export ABC transporter periplasmic protein LptC [Bacteroidales bacterium]|nr:LPS export ABC transporter periplasmic protein LptC [Bacteroidales bacterium]